MSAGGRRAAYWALVAFLVFVVFNARRWSRGDAFDYDPGGYASHVFGPVVLHRLAQPIAFEELQRRYRPQSSSNIGTVHLPNGRALSKYPIGWSLTLAPFYAATHLWTPWYGKYPPDGYSRPYQQSTILAGLFCGLLGLLLLHRTLRSYFSPILTLYVIAALTLGTNLFNYITYEANIAHASLFMWQSGLLLATRRWHQSFSRRDAAGIGLCLGMACLTRPTEMLFILLPLLWGVDGWAVLRQRPALLWRYRDGVALAVAIAACLLALQLAYWYVVSGHFIFYSYPPPEQFYFLQPHILNGLFSFRKGWLLYTPLMALALVGTYWLRGAVRTAWAPVLVLVPALVYVTFCWWQWWYGASFGCRPLINLYPLLALPLASVFQAATQRRWSARLLTGVVVGLVALNLLQTRQYRSAILHWDSETKELYFANFFRL